MVSLIVASRNSPLALRQVEEVFSLLPLIKYRLLPLSSYGDKHKNISLLDAPPPNIFTKELDEILLRRRADAAVHSAKDLPCPLPEGLTVLALLPAANPQDALVSQHNLPLRKLPHGAAVGTSSPLRRQELLSRRPDLQIVALRGNIGERLQKVDSGQLAAIVVAVCALQRLGLSDRITEILPFPTHPLQGHLAVVARTDRPDLRKIFQPLDVRRTWGRAALVGAGPGHPLLLTRQADIYLRQADIIFYDDLARDIAKTYSATKVYVGKRKGRQAYSQETINEKLYQAVKAGRKTVRLKGGDPFIFGRGGEELEYLQQRLVSVAVVPGITAALSAAALAQIPLTKRGQAASVALLSGHPAHKIKVPQTDTLVYYMAGTTLAAVSGKLLRSGLPPPAAAVCVLNASLPAQSIIRTTLRQLPSLKIKDPLILIVRRTAENDAEI
ncbi:hydroxymethylbilane synthase [Candidatus Termititenax persephonae]|uniref:Hydroxymethylbilane synthase n=1 Tax=Candidatus Termititenax persephonae TaxID=2218525 RepID=A0A388TJL0_9BACT|nr:hydroxymethylbilane synthase [Candidatus Termititenax persephonae]